MKRLLTLLLVGCASSPPPPPPPVLAPPPPPKPPAFAGATVVDPTTITGYVQGVGASPEHGPHDGEIIALESKPQSDYINELRFDLKGVGYYRVLVPRALPLPFSIGDRVAIRTTGQGGGPNYRVAMTMTAADGSVLFAVDARPKGWTVEEGKRVESRNEGDYIAHSHEVLFEAEGNKLTVRPGKWARFDVGDKSYYVWGSAVDRTRVKQGPLPLDYVGGWLDFAIVRAR